MIIIVSIYFSRPRRVLGEGEGGWDAVHPPGRGARPEPSAVPRGPRVARLRAARGPRPVLAHNIYM